MANDRQSHTIAIATYFWPGLYNSAEMLNVIICRSQKCTTLFGVWIISRILWTQLEVHWRGNPWDPMCTLSPIIYGDSWIESGPPSCRLPNYFWPVGRGRSRRFAITHTEVTLLVPLTKWDFRNHLQSNLHNWHTRCRGQIVPIIEFPNYRIKTMYKT